MLFVSTDSFTNVYAKVTDSAQSC